jgi:hypothetical protein
MGKMVFTIGVEELERNIIRERGTAIEKSAEKRKTRKGSKGI